MVKIMEFEIGDIKVGANHEPVVIAEIGINHGGSLDVAKKMVDAAVRSGIRVIKHQTHIVEDEMSPEANKDVIDYIGKTIYELMDDCSLNEEEEYELMQYVNKNGAIFISTPFSRAAAERLKRFDVPAFKIGSGECNNYPLIEHIAKIGKPVILSTGMNSLDTIKPAVEILRRNKIDFALMHTTNIYPTPPNLVRLGAMQQLAEFFPDAVIGLSDHTISNHACFGAVALGASILERHFTDNMQRVGPDIVCSMDEQAAQELVDGSRLLFLERGGEKGAVEEEKSVIGFAFSSVVAIKDILKGEILSEENIWVKRPGSGPFYAKDYGSLIGKKTASNILKGDHIAQKHLKNKL
jgi:N-acetylneuraminate synthase